MDQGIIENLKHLYNIHLCSKLVEMDDGIEFTLLDDLQQCFFN